MVSRVTSLFSSDKVWDFSGVSEPLRPFLREAVAEATRQSERFLAWMRLLLIPSVYLVYLKKRLGAAELEPLLMVAEAALTLQAVAFSVWMLRRAKRGPMTSRLVLTSVCFDAYVLFGDLATNAMAHDPEYHGALVSVDIALSPLSLMASSLRLSPRIVCSSACLIGIGVALVVKLDHSLGHAITWDATLVLLAYLVSAGGLSLLTAYGAFGLLKLGAEIAFQARKTRDGLMTVLSDHHDLRSVLCDLRLKSELLERALPTPSTTRELLVLVESIRKGVTRLETATSETQDRTLSALDAGHEISPTPALPAIESGVRAFGPESAQIVVLAFEPTDPLEGVLVDFHGGGEGLSRVVSLLVQNACEGSGTQRATRVVVSAETEEEWVRVTIRDDGPGFPDEVLARLGERGFSTKPGSKGLGLWLCLRELNASGGSLRLSNHPGGATATLVLKRSPRRLDPPPAP